MSHQSRKENESQPSGSSSWSWLAAGLVGAVTTYSLYTRNNERQQEPEATPTLNHFNRNERYDDSLFQNIFRYASLQQVKQATQPSKDEARKFKLCIKEVKENLEVIFSVSKVEIQGSTHKGTWVPKLADVDLVVFLNELRGIPLQNLEQEIKKCHNGYSSHLQKYEDFSSSRIVQVTQPEDTPNLLVTQLKYKDIDFDVAFVPSGICESPSIFQKSIDERYFNLLNPALVASRKKFIKSQDNECKELIRVVKFWNKYNKIGLPSYPLEILCIYFYETMNLEDCFINVVKTLQKVELMPLVKIEKYDPLHKGKPIFLDPISPTNFTFKRYFQNKLQRKTNIIEETINLLGTNRW